MKRELRVRVSQGQLMPTTRSYFKQAKISQRCSNKISSKEDNSSSRHCCNPQHNSKIRSHKRNRTLCNSLRPMQVKALSSIQYPWRIRKARSIMMISKSTSLKNTSSRRSRVSFKIYISNLKRSVALKCNYPRRNLHQTVGLGR